jgi:hypothetical protein
MAASVDIVADQCPQPIIENETAVGIVLASALTTTPLRRKFRANLTIPSATHLGSPALSRR